MRLLRRLLLLAWLSAGLMAAGAMAQDVLPVPPLSGRVIDQTATLDDAQRAALDAKLAAFEAQAGPQIVLLLVPSTAPEDIAAYAQRVADAWKIGRRAVGDGLLLVVAKNDRQVRIEVAKALEGAIPDLAARQVIDRAIVPAFRAGDYAGGLNAGVDQLMARIKGEGLPVPGAGAADASRRSGLPLQELGMFLFVGVLAVGGLLSALFGRKLASLFTALVAGGAAWWLSASLLLALGAAVATVLVVGVLGVGTVVRIVAMSAGRGGGGRGGGGGFSSGGGGDFGGGGASGRW
jgi:uncharacterized protein